MWVSSIDSRHCECFCDSLLALQSYSFSFMTLGLWWEALRLFFLQHLGFGYDTLWGRLKCGHSFMTLWSKHVASRGVLFGVIVLWDFNRNTAHCHYLCNDVVVTRRVFRLVIRSYNCYLKSFYFSYIPADRHTPPVSFLSVLHLLSYFFRSFFSFSFSLIPFSLFPFQIPFLSPMSTRPSILSHVARCDVGQDPLFSLVRFMDGFRNFLEGRRSTAMPLSGDVRTVCDKGHCMERHMAVGALPKRLCHWGGHGTPKMSCIYPYTDLLNVRCYERVGYERRLGENVTHVCGIVEDDWSFFVADVLTISSL